MTIHDVIGEVTALLGQPHNEAAMQDVGLAQVTYAIWVKDSAPYGLRLERVGERYTVRAWCHALQGRRAELIRHGHPTDDEIRSVAVMGGLGLNAVVTLEGGRT